MRRRTPPRREWKLSGVNNDYLDLGTLAISIHMCCTRWTRFVERVRDGVVTRAVARVNRRQENPTEGWTGRAKNIEEWKWRGWEKI